MRIEDDIMVQQAFMKAHSEYDAEEAERKRRQQDQAHQALTNRRKRAKEREERKKYLRENPEALEEIKNRILPSRADKLGRKD